MSRGNVPRSRTTGCVEENADGGPCGMPPLRGSDRCFTHATSAGAARAKARKRGGRNRRVGWAVDPPAEAPRLRDVDAIQQQLEVAVFDALQLENSNHRSRTIGYLLGFALKALEVGSIEERLAALENQSHQRPRIA
jgi:hypothetical protein